MLNRQTMVMATLMIGLATMDSHFLNTRGSEVHHKFTTKIKDLEKEYAKKTKKLTAFREWFESHGGIANNITFNVRLVDKARNQQLNLESFSLIGAPFARYEPRVFASADIHVDELLFRVPNHLILCRQTALQTEDPKVREVYSSLNSDEDILTLMLLREIALDADSFWRPYLELLPSFLNLPIFFSEDELDCMQNEKAKAYAKKSKHYLVRQYKDLRKALKVVLSDERIKKSRANSIGSLKAFVWAASIIEMRAVSIRGTRLLVPGPDFLWHAPKVNRPREKVAGNQFLRHHKLVRRNSSLDNSEMLHIDVTADRNFRSGDPGVEDFGDLRNELFLQHHGFVPSKNDFDCEIVPIPASHKSRNSVTRDDPRMLLDIVLGLFAAPETACLGMDRPLQWHAAQVTTIEYMPLPAVKACLRSFVNSLNGTLPLVIQESMFNGETVEESVRTFITWMKTNMGNLTEQFHNQLSETIEKEREFCFYSPQPSTNNLPLIEKSSGLILLPRVYEDFADIVKSLLEECLTSIIDDEMLLSTFENCFKMKADSKSGLSMCVPLTENERLAILFRIERKKMLNRLHQHLLDLAAAAGSSTLTELAYTPHESEIRGTLYRFVTSVQNLLDEGSPELDIETDCRFRVDSRNYGANATAGRIPVYHVCTSSTPTYKIQDTSLLSIDNIFKVRQQLPESSVLNAILESHIPQLPTSKNRRNTLYSNPMSSGLSMSFIGLVLELLPSKCSHHSWMYFVGKVIELETLTSGLHSALKIQVALMSMELHWKYCNSGFSSKYESPPKVPACQQRKELAKFQETFHRIQRTVKKYGASRLKHRVSWDQVLFAWRYVSDHSWWKRGLGLLIPRIMTVTGDKDETGGEVVILENNSAVTVQSMSKASLADQSTPCTWIHLRSCRISGDHNKVIHRLWQHGFGTLTFSECIPLPLPNEKLFSALQFVGAAAQLDGFAARIQCLSKAIEKADLLGEPSVESMNLVDGLNNLVERSTELQVVGKKTAHNKIEETGYSGMLCIPFPNSFGCPPVNDSKPDKFLLEKQLNCGTCVLCRSGEVASYAI